MDKSSARVEQESEGAAAGRPRFTFIIATYNYGRYLARAVESIVGQEGEDFEVLIIDDGSTDETAGIAARHAERRVRYVRQEHAGTFAACRTGCHESRGRYIIFVDADDRLRPGALGALRAAADARPDAQLILGRTCSIAEDGREVIHGPIDWSPDPLEKFARFARGDLRGSIAGALIDRRLLFAFDRPDGRYPYGMDRALLASALLHPLVQIDAVTLDVFAHPGRFRDDILAIHRSGLDLVDALFDPAIITPEAMRHRATFEVTCLLTRARAYHRAGWHSESWRSYWRAVRRSPRVLLQWRTFRRALGSLVRDLAGAPEGPSVKPPGNHAAIRRDTVAFLRGCAASCHPVARLKLRRTTYLVLDPVDARHVLSSHAARYRKTGIQRAFPILANSVIGFDGDPHRAARRELGALLQPARIAALAPEMLRAVDAHLSRWDTTGPLDVGAHGRVLCAAMAARVVFGVTDAAWVEQLVMRAQRAHRLVLRGFPRRLPWPRWLPIRRHRRYTALMHELDELLAPVVTARRAAAGDDVLSVFLSTRQGSPPPGVAELRDPLLMVFLAAFEPVTVTLALGLDLLARHPAVQARLATEVREFERAWRARPADILKLRYLGMVVAEIVRLHPNEWILTRRAAEEDRLPSGVRIRQGDEVMVSPLLLQHDARYFADPARFDPERFAGAPSWPAGAYLPFGAGPRSCLGEGYALMFLSLAIAAVVSACQLDPVPGETAETETMNLFSTHLRGGRLVLALRPRVAVEPGARETVEG